MENLESRGIRTPLIDEPEIDSTTAWFLRAFGVLSRSRNGGMGPGPIPLSEIVIYWDRVAAICALDEFIDMMQSLDEEYLKHQSEKSKNESTSG